jgi:surfeit locus 1 family protein
MRRIPILATLVVTAAVTIMIGLGIWQLERARWKNRLLTELSHAQTLPTVDLDRVIEGGTDLSALAFRRARVTCRAQYVVPAARAGRSLADVPGQVFMVPCRPGAGGLEGRLQVNAGWAPRHDAVRRISLAGPVAGTLGTVERQGPIILTAASARPPLEASAPPSLASIPNNHLFYAFQWFFFAVAAAVIYAIALRRRLPRADRAPKSARP